MLVLLRDSGSIQLACKVIGAARVCGCCKRSIQPGEYYTRHQAPDPKTYNPATGKTRMVPYDACYRCAPFTQLEAHTGEITLPKAIQRAKMEAAETFVQIPVVKTNTPRPNSSIQRRISSVLRPRRLEPIEEDQGWIL